jgi:hypothetical protein
VGAELVVHGGELLYRWQWPSCMIARVAMRRASCVAGQTVIWDGTPAIFTLNQAPGAAHADLQLR